MNYRYIVGVNQDAIEIEMTRPVPIKVTPMKTSPKIDYEMCFWLGTPYESQEVTKIITRKMLMNSPFRTSKFFFFSNHMPGSGNFLCFT